MTRTALTTLAAAARASLSCLGLASVALASQGLACAALAAVPAADHPAVLRALGHLGGSAQSIARVVEADHFLATDLVRDADGAEHVRLQRRHHGLPVIGGDLVVHSTADGAMDGVSQSLAVPIDLDLRPGWSAARAGTRALKQFGHREGMLAGQELVVWARRAQPVLAWQVSVHGRQADGTPSRARLILDARSGRLLDRWDDIHTGWDLGTGMTLYSGKVRINDTVNQDGTRYRLLDNSRGGHRVTNMHNTENFETNFVGPDNLWGTGRKTDFDTVAADAAYGAQVTWDYFKDVHGRLGIGGDGVAARSRVHFGAEFDNAFWSDDCFCMSYGDGWFFNPLVSLDVAGHEMTHGLTSRTAGLIYSDESGGLNEATSDIFGTMVEFHAGNAKDVPDYTIGEELIRYAGRPFRYMYSPNKDKASADCWFEGVGAIDVHYSSGVGNHFYYLLAEGSVPGDGLPSSATCLPGDTYKASGQDLLTGIGRDKAAKIWFRALTVYMTSDETYVRARRSTLRAAKDLYGAISPEAAAVAAAWTAVNVR